MTITHESMHSQPRSHSQTRWQMLSALLLAMLLPMAASADLPGKHPAYLHALSDLRAARWLLEHRPGDAAVSSREDVGIAEIDAAIGEIKKAAIDDGKDLHDHPGVQDIGDPRAGPFRHRPRRR